MVVASCLNAMHCLANMCYVCLEEKSKLISNINSSLSVNKDIIHIIGYLPINLAWLKTLRIILICEECCLRLRLTYQFLQKCLKNSALLQSYRDKLSTSNISNTESETELLAKLNITNKDMNEEKCEIQSEAVDISTFQWQPNIEAIGDVFVDFEDSLVKEGIICKKKVDDKQYNNSTEVIEQTEEVFVNLEDCFVKEENTLKQDVDDKEEYPTDNNSTKSMNNESDSEIYDNYSIDIIEGTEDVFVNVEDYFVKEENTWKGEEVDDKEEYPTDNSSTESMENKFDSEISVSDNALLTNTDCVSSGFTYKQVHTTNMNNLNTAAKKSFKCSTCSKSFFTKSDLNIHTDEKSFKCAICKTGYSGKRNLAIHMRLHTVKKPYNCTRCKKCFSAKSSLVRHERLHTGEKPYECSKCKKCFTSSSNFLSHMPVHTGEKPYECSKCKKCFSHRSSLWSHKRLHTGEKPYECPKCKKCFTHLSTLVTHVRIHSGEKPYECSKCKKCFNDRSNLMSHMRAHAGETPHECSKCKKCFTYHSHLLRHMRVHTGKKP